MSKFVFPVEQLRTFSYANGAKRMFAEVAIVNVPNNIPTDVNARAQNPRTGVSRAIRSSLQQDDLAEIFHLLNRGIVITAGKASFDKDSGMLSIAIDDPEIHGVLDGGHTYVIVTEYADKHPESKARVFMEILVGVEDFQADIVGARNTSVQVDAPSLLNVKGEFNPILSYLDAHGIPKDWIKVRMNEDKTIEIAEILSIMYLFDVNQFGNGMDGVDKPPILAFTGKGSIVKHFKEHTETFTKKMLPLLPDILYLWDYVGLRLLQHYRQGTGNASGRPGRKNGNSADPAPGLYMPDVTVDHGIAKAYRLMLMAAVRCMVDNKGKKYAWKNVELPDVPKAVKEQLGREATPIEKFYEAVAAQLHRQLWPATDGVSPTQVGKQSMLWNNLYMIALRYMMEIESV
jgi:hypothetical protein